MTMRVEKQVRKTAAVPVPRRGEAPIMSEGERAAFISSLKAAEARITAGDYVEHDPDTFVDRLMEIRAEAIRNSKA